MLSRATDCELLPRDSDPAVFFEYSARQVILPDVEFLLRLSIRNISFIISREINLINLEIIKDW